MRINFANIENVDEFEPLPDGQYLCRLAHIDETTTVNGEAMWKIRFNVAHGPHKGRNIYDNLPFTPKSMKRVKLVCIALGLDCTQEVDLMPSLLQGRYCNVTVYTQDYEDNHGQTKSRNSVPFAGYTVADNTVVQVVQMQQGDCMDVPL